MASDQCDDGPANDDITRLQDVLPGCTAKDPSLRRAKHIEFSTRSGSPHFRGWVGYSRDGDSPKGGDRRSYRTLLPNSSSELVSR